MILSVKPSRFLRGRIKLPPSKSYSIRAFIIAACGGQSLLINSSDSEDVKIARSVARHLGAVVLRVQPNAWLVKAKRKKVNLSHINVGESGTVLRFLLPLVCLHDQKSQIDGKGTLKGRPNYHLIRTLRAQGIQIKGSQQNESIPILKAKGQLKAGRMEIAGSVSSQFISALLIACPQLSRDSTIVIKGKRVVSSDYITMTLKVLQKSGVKIQKVHERLYKIKGGQQFKGLKNFTIPSDYGLVAFLLATGALIPTQLVLEGYLNDELIQADGKIFDFLVRMGVRFKKSSQSILLNGPFFLKGGNFSLKDCPDLLPIMSILALFAKGKTRLYHIQHARVKESDRVTDLRTELMKVGAKIKEERNAMTIYPQKEYQNNVLLNPHHDHRLAMAFSILGLKLSVKIKDIECVNKSYPDFIKDLQRIGGTVFS